MDNSITTLEMCAGYGGIGLGLKNIFGERLRTIAYCELEGFAQANLISKMEAGLLDAAPIWSDLKTFPYGSFHGLVDILIAGYPCQPFSAAGKRAGKDDPRHLWPFIADGIRILRPRMCFFENVEGHISLGLREVIGELEQIGYTAAWGIFSASVDAGAPHQRKRVFILAVSNSLGGAAGVSRSLAWNEGIAGVVDDCGGEGSELGNAGHLQSGRWAESVGPQHANPSNTSEDMGHTINEGMERSHDNGTAPGGIQPHAVESSDRTAWPSRPGEPQHGWEPPRVVANDHRPHAGHGEQRPERTPRDLSAGCGEAMGNASQREDNGRESRDLGQEAGEGRCGDHAADGAGEGVGNADCGRQSSSIDTRSCSETIGRGEGNIEQTECRQTQQPMGDPAYGTKFGMGLSELSGLSHSELAEIYDWMVKTDNRTDELRLLGNGVVPATAERAFRILLEELK